MGSLSGEDWRQGRLVEFFNDGRFVFVDLPGDRYEPSACFLLRIRYLVRSRGSFCCDVVEVNKHAKEVVPVCVCLEI